MKPSHPLRALGRSVVARLPRPLADTLRTVKRAALNQQPMMSVFRNIYAGNHWDGTESVSGPGSTMAATANIRAALPFLIEELGIKTVLDVPCGDAYWISTCLPAGISYIGGDIVPELIERNRRNKSSLGKFEVLDLVTDRLPTSDLIIVRDCLIHLPNHLVIEALQNIKRSGITYLLTTTFTKLERDIDIELGGFRPVDLKMPTVRATQAQSTRLGRHGFWKEHGVVASLGIVMRRLPT